MFLVPAVIANVLFMMGRKILVRVPYGVRERAVLPEQQQRAYKPQQRPGDTRLHLLYMRAGYWPTSTASVSR